MDPVKIRHVAHGHATHEAVVTRDLVAFDDRQRFQNDHGYFLPHEGENDIALALFSFPSLAAYEVYREAMAVDADCQAAFAYAEETRCILRYERSFMRPMF